MAPRSGSHTNWFAQAGGYANRVLSPYVALPSVIRNKAISRAAHRNPSQGLEAKSCYRSDETPGTTKSASRTEAWGAGEANGD